MDANSITSRSSVVCGYQLYSIARDIGKYSFLLVLYLISYHISKPGCCRLGDLIITYLFSHEYIKSAAYHTLNQQLITFSTFGEELLFSYAFRPCGFATGFSLYNQ